jgi:hypothetical protein
MKKFYAPLLASLALSLAAAFPSIVKAATVYVSYYQLSPDPVYINVGDVVYWDDGDDLGPYAITGGWGTIYTPSGIQFNVPPGSYGYSAESVLYGGGAWDGTVIVTAPSPPSVSITSPTNNSVFTAPATFTFAADASDPIPNNISDVEFRVGNQIVNDVISAPYATTVTNLAAGTYTLTAIATDNSLLTATNSITITVVNPAPITFTGAGMVGGNFVFYANGLIAGKTNVLQCSSNLISWVPIQTNLAGSTSLVFTNPPSARCQFFRLIQFN